MKIIKVKMNSNICENDDTINNEKINLDLNHLDNNIQTVTSEEVRKFSDLLFKDEIISQFESKFESKKLKFKNSIKDIEYDYYLYDIINDENEKVRKYIEDVYLEKNEFKLEDVINEPLQSIIDSLHMKVYTQKLICTSNNLRLFELTSSERKILLISYYLFVIQIIPQEKSLKKFGEDNLVKILKYTLKVPYCDFYLVIANNLINFENFEKFFNYEHLIILNIAIYSSLKEYDKENKCFTTSLILHYHLRKIVRKFEVLELYKDNKDLFNRFYKLNAKFPDSKINIEIYME